MPVKIKIFSKRVYTHANYPAYIASIFAFLVTVTILSANVYLADAASLSFGFGSSNDVVKGMIVSVDQEDTNSVEQAHVNNAEYVIGVAVDQASSSIVFDNDDAVYVATGGTVGVFVSTVGGDIVKGDLITVSTVGGVGRKKLADAPGQKVIGVAKSDFDESSPNAERITLENAGEISIGVVEVELLLSGALDTQDENFETNVLIRIGQRLAGRPVSLSQVIITASVITVTFVVSGALLFGAIKGSFTAIGRNPLSAKTIYRGMMRASIISLIVMALGIAAGYVVLII